jgi:hypothetical protein
MRQDLIPQQQQQQDINYNSNNNQMFIPQSPQQQQQQQQQPILQSPQTLQQIKSSDEIEEQFRQHTR